MSSIACAHIKCQGYDDMLGGKDWEGKMHTCFFF